MSIKKFLAGTLALAICSSVAGYASTTPEAMRAATAVMLNTKLASSVSLTKDNDDNIISFHVNGVNPTDADILLKRDSAPLSTEYTVVSGVTKEGSTYWFMIPSNIATASVIETISKDLVNAGSMSLKISKHNNGRF